MTDERLKNRLQKIVNTISRRALKRAPSNEPWEEIELEHLDLERILEIVGPDDADITPDGEVETYLVGAPASAIRRLRLAEEQAKVSK